MFQLAIPIEIITPRMMQMVWREPPAIFLQLPRVGLLGRDPWDHPTFLWHFIGFQQIASAASGYNIFPSGAPPARARDHMVKGQILRLELTAAILAAKLIAQKDIKPRKGRVRALLNVIFQRDHTRQAHRNAGRMNITVIFRNDRHAIQKHRLDGVLPRPER